MDSYPRTGDGAAEVTRPEDTLAGGEQAAGPSIWLLGRWLARIRPGQSLVEIALIFAPVLMLLLIAANVGLAVHAHTNLAQATQQAVQIFLHHPEPNANCNNGKDDISGYATLADVQSAKGCYADDVAWYLHNHGFSDVIRPIDMYNSITVTLSTDNEVVGSSPYPQVQIATVNIHYDFPIVAPVLDNLSFGPLQSGRFNLGAVASTIAATTAPTIASVTPPADRTDPAQPYIISIQPGTPAALATPGVWVTYCGYYANTVTMGVVSSTGPLVGPFCNQDFSTSPSTSIDVTDPDCSLPNTSCTFQATALQANGLESPLSTPPVSP